MVRSVPEGETTKQADADSQRAAYDMGKQRTSCTVTAQIHEKVRSPDGRVLVELQTSMQRLQEGCSWQ